MILEGDLLAAQSQDLGSVRPANGERAVCRVVRGQERGFVSMIRVRSLQSTRRFVQMARYSDVLGILIELKDFGSRSSARTGV